MYGGKQFITIIVGMTLCLFFMGCSGAGIQQSPVIPSHTPQMNPGHTMLGLYELAIDSVMYTVEVYPKREASAHFDVAPMLMNPNICPSLNCLQVQLESYDPVEHIFNILVTLRNPMTLTGYDVRGIVFRNPDHEHELLNFDAYVSVFSTPWFDFNPFIAFARDEEFRAFGAQQVHSQTFELKIPPQPNPFLIDYAVDASWPGNCLEPYDIVDQLQIGALTDETGSECVLSCKVKDWQDPIDMQSVVVDGESISGTAILMSYNMHHQAWECTVPNNMGAVAGEYILSITAMAHDSFFRIKDFITVTVIEGSSIASITGTVVAYSGGGPMPGVFCFCTDGENIYSDLSDDKGQYELFGVPEGGRVMSFNDTGTLGQYHDIDLTISGAVVDAEMPLVYLYVPAPPELDVNPPEIDEINMKATISGTVDQYYDNNKVIIIVDGEESLYESDEGNFSEEIPIHAGMNMIRVRASNAKGNTFSDWIEIEI